MAAIGGIGESATEKKDAQTTIEDSSGGGESGDVEMGTVGRKQEGGKSEDWKEDEDEENGEDTAMKADTLPPDHPDYKPQKGWQLFVVPAAIQEIFGKKKNVQDEDLFLK